INTYNFFFSSRRRHTRFSRDWSSDVCSSDLHPAHSPGLSRALQARSAYTRGMRASDRAYTALREEIVSGLLPPGALLGEVEQSGRLGISRTPLREALARLVADGLAEPAPGRGLVVTAVSLEEAEPLFDLRIALESLAARRAAEQVHSTADGPDLRHRFLALATRFEAAREPLAAGADPTDYYALTGELDAAVDEACGNTYLAESLRGLRLHLGRVRRLARNSPARLADSAREHADIARSVASGDPELAAASTIVHLRHALAHLLGAASPTTAPTASPTFIRQEASP